MPTLRPTAAVLLAALTCAGACTPPQPEGLDAPNILFVLTDDHRYDALGYLGHRGQVAHG